MAKETQEIGNTGLPIYNGQIRFDFLREFHGIEAYKRFNEMRLNNSTIGAGLLAIEFMLRSMSWNFVSDEEEDPWLELVEDSRAAMTQGWNDLISEIESFVWAGYSVLEKVYQRDERGRLMWRKFSIRGQDTIYQWLFDDKGGLSGIRQLAAPTYKATDIPIEKLILFRTRSEKNNPEGLSLLRTAWVSYYYLKNIQQTQAIGYERDANGMPVVKLPQGASTNEDDINSDASKAAKIVRNVRNDEQAGLTIPFGWEFELLSGGGKSFAQMEETIKRLESRIAMTMFSQFLLLGQDGVGSLALSENTMDFFLSAVNAVADIITDTFTKFAVRPLLKLNGATDEEAERVRLEHTSASNVDLEGLTKSVQAVKELLTWDADDELWIRQMIGAPEKDVEELQTKRDEETARKQSIADAIRNAQPKEQQEQQMTVFAADAPDDARRRKFEREWTKIMKPFLEKQKRRIVRKVKSNAT